jgi:hypothetical protein
MPGYQIKQQTLNIGGTDYRIRSLLDLQQYSDPLFKNPAQAYKNIHSFFWISNGLPV